MERYRVHSIPDPSLAPAWEQYLDGHVPEVVLAGGFTGAEVVQEGQAVAIDYAAGEGRLQRYFEEHAPALRESTARRFPVGIAATRAVEPLRLKVSAPFDWAALGLVDAQGEPVPCPTDGPYTLAVFAPWCPDCDSSWPELLAALKETPGRGALVGAFAPAAEVVAFAEAHGTSGAPVLREPSERTESDRVRSFHAVLRQLTGDARRWGVPAVRRLWIGSGRFCVRWT